MRQLQHQMIERVWQEYLCSFQSFPRAPGDADLLLCVALSEHGVIVLDTGFNRLQNQSKYTNHNEQIAHLVTGAPAAEFLL